MGIFEFNQELYDKALLEDGEEKGIVIAARIQRQIQAGKTDNTEIAKLSGCTVEKVEMFRKELEI